VHNFTRYTLRDTCRSIAAPRRFLSKHRVLFRKFSSSFRNIDRNEVFHLLGLTSLSSDDIQKCFDRYKAPDGNLDISEVRRSLATSRTLSTKEIDEVVNELFVKHNNTISDVQFDIIVKGMAKKFDTRVWPIALSFVLTGISVGVIVPCMPILVNEINMPSYQFGMVVSSFGIAKLFGNIPSSHFVSANGRKPLITAGLGITAVGIGGLGAGLIPGLGFPWIFCCRLLTGIGVSAITTGGQMYLADISTRLNRVQTMTPVMMGFQAGMSLGPAIGGSMIETIGVGPTYYTVGGLILGVAALNMHILSETLRTPQVSVPKPKLKDAFSTSVASWKRIVRQYTDLNQILLVNTAYWTALSGIQMTALPMFMVGSNLSLGPSEIGFCFASMAVTSVAMSQPLAYIADRYSKKYLMLVGCGLISSSSMLLPFASSVDSLMISLLPLALGSTIMQNVPTAYVVNICHEDDKVQATNLLRTLGDVGLIVGGTTSGVLAAVLPLDAVIQTQGLLLLATTAYIWCNSYQQIFRL